MDTAAESTQNWSWMTQWMSHPCFCLMIALAGSKTNTVRPFSWSSFVWPYFCFLCRWNKFLAWIWSKTRLQKRDWKRADAPDGRGDIRKRPLPSVRHLCSPIYVFFSLRRTHDQSWCISATAYLSCPSTILGSLQQEGWWSDCCPIRKPGTSTGWAEWHLRRTWICKPHILLGIRGVKKMYF